MVLGKGRHGGATARASKNSNGPHFHVHCCRYRKFGRSRRLISQLSLGATSFGNIYGTFSSEQPCHDVLLTAIKAGVNLIDTAPWYGHGTSESILGRGLKAIPRQAYYLSTKVGRYGPHVLEMFDFTFERTIASVKQSLARLQVDYIDVIQVCSVDARAPAVPLLTGSRYRAGSRPRIRTVTRPRPF